MMRSCVPSANDPANDFPIENLPFGIFSTTGDSSRRIGVRIGDEVFDLREYSQIIKGIDAALGDACKEASLNNLMRLGRPAWSKLRQHLTTILQEGHKANDLPLVAIGEAQMHLPALIGDYTDFYASIYHATNVGSMFRPENPLLPNYKYLPVAYHGRASSVVVSGHDVKRPHGQIATEGVPQYALSRALDYEAELGVFIGTGNDIGSTVSIEEAGNRVFGVCLANDWSARDIQRWEYQPLGPFLAKSFLTTVSPWVVTVDALEPFRTRALERPASDPRPLPHLYSESDQKFGGIDLHVEVLVQSQLMRQSNIAPIRLSEGNFRDMYWTLAQMVAHHTSNGCNLRPGDLLASGTISGQSETSRGSLLELTWGGKTPIKLPTGEERKFLENGDEVIMRGWCERDGARRIGLGECRGMIRE